MLRLIPQTSLSDLFYSSDDTASTESDTDIGLSTNDDYECTNSDVNMDECAYYVNSCTPGITNVNSHIDSTQVCVHFASIHAGITIL